VSVTTASVVWCDQNCANSIVIATDLEHAREAAAKAGWILLGGRDHCPIHAAGSRLPWQQDAEANATVDEAISKGQPPF
jgi:hypothetical protein